MRPPCVPKGGITRFEVRPAPQESAESHHRRDPGRYRREARFQLCARDAAAPDLMDRELLGLAHIDARRRQRGFEASVPGLLPGLLRLPDLADAKVQLLSEQHVELEHRWGTVGAVLPKDLVDLVVLLACERRRRV